MRRIVGDLQLLTELDEDIRPVMTEVDLNEIVREAVYDVQVVGGDHGWVTEQAPGELVVHGDADQLRQVVANLLANVRVHTPPGTVARVLTRRDGDRAVLEVADTGPGVPADELLRLFHRFWRHDASRARASGGSGLGLAIVSSIVQAHGGTVAAALGQRGGLTISVALPGAARATAGPGALRAPA